MENDSYVPDNIPADLEKSWHIPRPTLARSSKSSQGSTSSNNSTQSARSGSLLLTAANLAQIQPDPEDPATARAHNLRLYLHQTGGGGPPPLAAHDQKNPHNKKSAHEKKDLDSVSVASSTHFTVVNVNQRQSAAKRSFCRRHQLTMLVMTMSGLITVGILTAILLLEMRAQNQKH